jgi:ribosomal-protein-alanine N-acetyltransferase
MTAQIRVATAEDAPRLARLHRACFADAWDEAWFARYLADDHSLALVAMPTGSSMPEAFILFRTAASECEILSLGTWPAARRRGLARLLVEAAAKAAMARGAGEMFLEVAEDNPAARKLYEGLGFVAVGRRPGYYRMAAGPAVDAVTLRAALPLSAGVSH